MRKYNDKCTDIYAGVIDDEYALDVLHEKEATIDLLCIALEDTLNEVQYYKKLLWVYALL